MCCDVSMPPSVLCIASGAVSGRASVACHQRARYVPLCTSAKSAMRGGVSSRCSCCLVACLRPGRLGCDRWFALAACLEGSACWVQCASVVTPRDVVVVSRAGVAIGSSPEVGLLVSAGGRDRRSCCCLALVFGVAAVVVVGSSCGCTSHYY